MATIEVLHGLSGAIIWDHAASTRKWRPTMNAVQSANCIAQLLSD